MAENRKKLSASDVALLESLEAQGMHADADDFRRALDAEGIGSLHELFSPRAFARPGEPGHSPDWLTQAMPEARVVWERALGLWRDGELAGYFQRILVRSGIQGWEQYPADPALFEAEEGTEEWEDLGLPFFDSDLPALLGVPGGDMQRSLDILETVAAHVDAWEDDGREPDVGETPIGIVAGLLLDEGKARRPRLVQVSRDTAQEFIQRHHSALGWNPKGLMYTLGVRVGSRLVAVATVGHPPGRYTARVSPYSVLYLSRIASDGTTKGASSMLAAKAMDLLPYSGRKGNPGLLFATHSLATEAGTTYVSLIDRGLRPVEYSRGRMPSGARAAASLEALSHLDKVLWEAGPAAATPDWEAMARALLVSDPIRIAKLQEQGREAEAERLASTSIESRVAVMRARFDAWEAREANRRR